MYEGEGDEANTLQVEAKVTLRVDQVERERGGRGELGAAIAGDDTGAPDRPVMRRMRSFSGGWVAIQSDRKVG